MTPPDIVPMPSRLQRLAAFGGFLAYLLTQAQVDAHRKQRAQLLETATPAADAPRVVGPWLLPVWDEHEHHREGEVHFSTPHLHTAPLGDPLASWPHTHDG